MGLQSSSFLSQYCLIVIARAVRVALAVLLVVVVVVVIVIVVMLTPVPLPLLLNFGTAVVFTTTVNYCCGTSSSSSGYSC